MVCSSWPVRYQDVLNLALSAEAWREHGDKAEFALPPRKPMPAAMLNRLTPSKPPSGPAKGPLPMHLTVLSTGHHASYPVAISAMWRALLPEYEIQIQDHSFDDRYCQLHGTCSADSRFAWLGEHLRGTLVRTCGGHYLKGFEDIASLAEHFFELVVKDSTTAQVDLLLCTHPPYSCRLFWPFVQRLGWPLLGFFGGTLEAHVPEEGMTAWLQDFQAMAQDPRVQFAAIAPFLAEKMRFQSGVDIPASRGFGFHVIEQGGSYFPRRWDEVLLWKGSSECADNEEAFNDAISAVSKSVSQGPTSYAASHAYGISSEKMLNHLGITPKIAWEGNQDVVTRIGKFDIVLQRTPRNRRHTLKCNSKNGAVRVKTPTGAKKGKQKDSSKAASSTGDQSNASPGAYEATAPDWDEWHEDNCYAGQGRSYALYNEQQSYSHATFASNQKNKSNHREEAQAVERYAPGKIEFTFSPSNTKFSFADSETALIKENVTLWFKATPPRDTTVEVLDQGRVPILFSIEHMRNLRMTWPNRAEAAVRSVLQAPDKAALAKGRWQITKDQAAWDKLRPATFSGVFFQMPMSTDRSRVSSDDAAMPEPDEDMRYAGSGSDVLLRFMHLRELRESVEGASYSSITSFRAVVFVPYEVLLMTFYELYHAAIPIFIPEKEIGVFFMYRGPVTFPHCDLVLSKTDETGEMHSTTRQMPPYSPFNRQNVEARLSWLEAYTDWYQWPHNQLTASCPAPDCMR
ncbi:hypothetical protein AK812_SmicGene34859 [Symbiodinium microadriaticum]|uniref:Uncharacterized protein n=1 Tax=Symbiodinium microadriaticum TaxID=2951 RepID=A0A1Q9CMY2_SYMMI|nr:hypothetical protein AK812_SmicGene34859 [Symbiodinium microadriaticum]